MGGASCTVDLVPGGPSMDSGAHMNAVTAAASLLEAAAALKWA